MNKTTTEEPGRVFPSRREQFSGELGGLKKNIVKTNLEIGVQIERLERFASHEDGNTIQLTRDQLVACNMRDNFANNTNIDQEGSNIMVDNPGLSHLIFERFASQEKASMNPKITAIREELNSVFQSLTQKMQEFSKESGLYECLIRNPDSMQENLEAANKLIKNVRMGATQTPPKGDSKEMDIEVISSNQQQQMTVDVETNSWLLRVVEALDKNGSIENLRKYYRQALLMKLYRDRSECIQKIFIMLRNLIKQKAEIQTFERIGTPEIFEKDRQEGSDIILTQELESSFSEKIKQTHVLQIESQSSQFESMQLSLREKLAQRIEAEVDQISFQKLTPHLPRIEEVFREIEQENESHRDLSSRIDVLVELIKNKSTLWKLLIDTNFEDSAPKLLEKILNATSLERNELELKAQHRVELANKTNRNQKMIILSLLGGRYAIKSAMIPQ